MKKRSITLNSPVMPFAYINLGPHKAHIEDIYQDADSMAHRFSETAICKRGCSHCCHIDVGVNYLEAAYLVQFMNQNLSAKTRLQIGSKFEKLRTRYKKEFGNYYVVSAERNMPTSNFIHVDLNAEYALRPFPMVCPLLVHGECIVYAARPLACRIYQSAALKDCRDAQATPLMEQPDYESARTELNQRIVKPSCDLSQAYSLIFKSVYALSVAPHSIFRLIGSAKNGDMAIICFNSFKQSGWMIVR